MKSATTRSSTGPGSEFRYAELDINQKINLKGIVAGWNPIAIERFQTELAQKVYSSSTTQAGRKRASWRRQSGNLLRDWRSRLYGDSDGLLGTQLSFLLYGRFVDMGVGKGIDAAEAKYRRVRRNGEPTTRKAKKWYPRRLGYETHRLRELLTRHYVEVSLDALETYLDGSVTIHV